MIVLLQFRLYYHSKNSQFIMFIPDYKPYNKGSIGTELTWFFLRENATRIGEGEYEARMH